MTSQVEHILEERGSRYGSFMGNGVIAQRLKAVLREECGSRHIELEADQAEALDMIAHKVARIINGDPNYIDSWDDIAGYATLVANRLRADVQRGSNGM